MRLVTEPLNQDLEPTDLNWWEKILVDILIKCNQNAEPKKEITTAKN